jgi:hypothetical protein
MSGLIEGSVTIRDVTYTVREISGRHMREVRKRLKDSPETVEAYLAWACTIEPKFASESAAADESHLVLKTISEEAFRLSQPPVIEAEAKND